MLSDVESIVIHPDFYKDKDNSTVHDLALLKLTNGYGSEEIDTEEAKFFAKTFKGNDSQILRTKQVNIIKKIKVYLTLSACNKDPYRHEDEKPSLLYSSTFGIWTGDSGGPLIKMSQNSGNCEVIAIARSALLCPSGIATAYTRISHYVPWIQENLEKFDETPDFDIETAVNSGIDFFDFSGIAFSDYNDIQEEEVNDMKINIV